MDKSQMHYDTWNKPIFLTVGAENKPVATGSLAIGGGMTIKW